MSGWRFVHLCFSESTTHAEFVTSLLHCKHVKIYVDFVYSCHRDLLNSLLQRPFQRILLSSSSDNKSSDCTSSEDATVLAKLMFKSINNVLTIPVENGNVDGEYSDVLQVSSY